MKQQITKNAIETAFLRLLKDRYFEKVMVKDIVEECGLTRNTFYYYYEDTYNIIADILEREIREIELKIDEGCSLEQASVDVFEFLGENPKVARHLFLSSKKDDIYQYIRSAVEIVLRHWIDKMTQGNPINERDKKIILNMYKYGVQGLIEEWVQHGMKYSLQEEVERTQVLFMNSFEQVIHNCKGNKK